MSFLLYILLPNYCNCPSASFRQGRISGGGGAKVGVNAPPPSNIRKPSPECKKIELFFSGGERLLAQEQGQSSLAFFCLILIHTLAQWRFLLSL